MAYLSKKGRRPAEWASKSAHGHIIKDTTIQEFLKHCNLPKRAEDVSLANDQLIDVQEITNNPIQHVIAVDSGYTEVPVQVEFPTATICFFQFGALIFSLEDLDSLEQQPFIDPEDMAKLKRIQRLKFTLPVRNVALQGEANLINSVRRSVYNFFIQDIDGSNLITTLKWLVFEEYSKPSLVWQLANCPICFTPRVQLQRQMISKDYTFKCSQCGGEIFLTDVFRLHEAVDNELGAGGILGYVATAFEQIIIAHLIRLILETKPNLLSHVLFIKDGPLAFFGQTANLHKPMRALVCYLLDNQNLFMAGLEKSGGFVEHADEVSRVLNPGQIILLDNEYIYKYILPGKADNQDAYGSTTYYANKVIFKTKSERMYVINVPTRVMLQAPKENDFPNLQTILANVEKLKCDMYDDALIPVALVNKLVSLANHPSSKILQKFAIGSMANK
ncbi:MAG: NurA domain-containing protein [Chloroflexi bacterium]|nr:NurA domain-containing protein [Chloroflexota bacterium]